jgi:hypothetical protein
MAALRLELEITTVEPSGTMVFVEGHAPGGVQVGLMIPPSTLTARVGQRLAVSLETLGAASSMRERMVRPTAVTTDAPRSATTTPSTSAATAGSTQEARTDAVLAAVFGTSPAAERERDVNEEMDALFGRRQ